MKVSYMFDIERIVRHPWRARRERERNIKKMAIAIRILKACIRT